MLNHRSTHYRPFASAVEAKNVGVAIGLHEGGTENTFTSGRACESGIRLCPRSDACEALITQAFHFSIPFLI